MSSVARAIAVSVAPNERGRLALLRREELPCARSPFSGPSPPSALPSRESARAPRHRTDADRQVREGEPRSLRAGKLSLATDNLSFPPWWGGKDGHGFDPSDPYSGKGYEGAVSYEVAKRLGFCEDRGDVEAGRVQQGDTRPGRRRTTAYISQVSYKPARAKAVDFSSSYYFVNQAVVGIKGTPITKVKTVAGPQAVHARRARRHDELQLHRQVHQAERRSPRSTTRSTTRSPPSRTSRSTGSSSTSRAPATSRASRSRPRRSSAACPRRARGALRARLPEGLVARHVRQQGACRDAGGRDAEAATSRSGSRARADPEVAQRAERRPRLEDRRQPDGRPLRRPRGRDRARLDRRLLRASSSSPSSRRPAGPRSRRRSSTGRSSASRCPGIASAFLTNVKIFCIAEVVILFTALGLAVLRSLPGPVFFPLRVLAIVYSDFFRGIPTILLVYLLGFGIPALGLPYVSEPELLWGVPAEMVWGTVALILVYTAYVSEVYRAGIESVHSSQNAAARSLGLSHGQSLRYVVVPQAVRRVIPPLLNDFIGLQKDTALVALDRRRRGVPAVADRLAPRRSTSRRTSRGVHVPARHDAADAAHRLPDRARPQAPPDAARWRYEARSALEDVHKSFGKVEVLRGIDLDVAEHDVVCLIGASGSGKSTLLRCVNLLEPIDSGRIFVDGEEITARRRRRQPRAARHRHRLPGVQPLPAHERARQRHARAAQGAGRVGRREAESEARRSCSPASASPTRPTSTPTGCPAASSSARRSCARSRCGLSCCCSTR